MAYLDALVYYITDLGEVQIRSEESLLLFVFEVDDVVVGAFIIADVDFALEEPCVNYEAESGHLVEH